MADRKQLALPVNGVSTIGNALSGASTGVKLSYTCPAGRQARVVMLATSNFAGGAPVVQTRLTISAATIVTGQSGANRQDLGTYFLQAGDVADLNVSTLAAASAFDGCITVEEFLTA